MLTDPEPSYSHDPWVHILFANHSCQVFRKTSDHHVVPKYFLSRVARNATARIRLSRRAIHSLRFLLSLSFRCPSYKYLLNILGNCVLTVAKVEAGIEKDGDCKLGKSNEKEMKQEAFKIERKRKADAAAIEWANKNLAADRRRPKADRKVATPRSTRVSSRGGRLLSDAVFEDESKEGEKRIGKEGDGSAV